MCPDNRIVYADLRAKHFVIKDGMHYGADFTIYEEPSSDCHSYALVYVRHQEQALTVNSVVRWTRVAESTRKKTIVALVDCNNETVKYMSINRLKLA